MASSFDPFGILAPLPLPEPPPELLLRLPERVHWAQRVFEGNLPASRLKHQRVSRCFGLPMPDVALEIPTGSKVLFKLPFDKNLLSVMIYLHPDGDNPRILCRWTDRDGAPQYAAKGVHELCVRRRGSSLQFSRWSTQRHRPKLWLALFFRSWEKMALFHDAFISLKARCRLTLNCHPDEFVLGGERKLAQARITDDEFDHVLTLYKDKSSSGIRLSATVREGPLKKSPVWTAFVTEECTSLRWARPRGRSRMWLRDLDPIIFCDKYNPRNQRTPSGDFELNFMLENARDQFMEEFEALRR